MECTLLMRLLLATHVVAMRHVLATGYEQPYYSYQRSGQHGDGEYMSDWANDWDQSLEQQKCIDIPQNMTLCKDIGYTQMRIPNLLDHDTVREVTQQASSWVPLLGIRCHPDTKLFLCSLFSPVCLDRPIWPCRTLCEAVKNGCEALMLKYGFPWPEMLRCDKFPPDNDLCIGLQHDNKPVASVPDEGVCEVCTKPETYEAIVDNFCSANFVYKVDIKENIVSGADLKLTTDRKKKKVKQGDITKRDLRNMLLYIEGGANCDCRHLSDDTMASRTGGKKSSGGYLAMGARKGDKLVLQYLIPNNKRDNKDLKRAWKAMKRGDVCEDGLRKLHRNNGKLLIRDRDELEGEPRGPTKPHTQPEPNNDRQQEGKKRRRKKCKNPKKCVSTEEEGEGKQRGRKRQRQLRNGRRRQEPLGYLFS